MPELTFLEKLFVFFQHVVPQHWLSRCIGLLAESKVDAIKNHLIRQFIRQFKVDMASAKNSDPTSYASFNDFFTRPLAENARPIDHCPSSICSPADGVISECGHIDENRLLQAKGFSYDLETLMGDDRALASYFYDGEFATIYLSPKDYHRVHMPIDGKLKSTRYVPGKLFSVNNVTAQSVPHLFARNERLICLFDSNEGPFALVLVGAMVVAGIETTWAGQVTPLSKVSTQQVFDQEIHLKKGEEMGRFKLGSTVIALFPKDRIARDSWRTQNSTVKMGEKIAEGT